NDGSARISGNRADVILQAHLRLLWRRHDNKWLAATMEADQRRRILPWSAILAAEGNGVARGDGETAGRELMQGEREPVLFEQIAGLDVDIDERGLHVGQVQLSLAVGAGADAAIGDHHCAAVGEKLDVVRLHAVSRELADLLVAVGRIADA